MAQGPGDDELARDGAADGGVLSDAGTARTVIPGLNRAMSETITFSPALTPLSMIVRVPTCSAV